MVPTCTKCRAGSSPALGGWGCRLKPRSPHRDDQPRRLGGYQGHRRERCTRGWTLIRGEASLGVGNRRYQPRWNRGRARVAGRSHECRLTCSAAPPTRSPGTGSIRAARSQERQTCEAQRARGGVGPETLRPSHVTTPCRPHCNESVWPRLCAPCHRPGLLSLNPVYSVLACLPTPLPLTA